MSRPDYTLAELMIVEGARCLHDGQVVFVGTGLPVAATMLAERTHAPGLILIAETGTIAPQVLPGVMAVSDPRICYRAVRIGSLLDVLGCILQRGLCDVGFLGGAQIDRYGNLNSTSIGDPCRPTARLVGSGGASDIAACAKKTLIITRHERRRFVERCDYLTSPGFLDGPGARERAGLLGGGPERIITDLGVLGFHPETKQMMVEKLHPGVTFEALQEQTGFPLLRAGGVAETEPPDAATLAVLRHEVDPHGTYARAA
jgi:acyl CoA:acetate/3-ketoacid CoA transferase beta subunit